MTDVPWRELDTVFLDAGNTLVSIDFGWVQRELASRGVEAEVEALRRAEAAARPLVSEAAAQRGGTEGQDAFAFTLEVVLSQLPAAKAGVGSAVNDTTRELGGTLGVAVGGSVFSSVYISTLGDGPIFGGLSEEAREVTEESVVGAGQVAQTLGADAPAFLDEISDAFLSGLAVSCLVVAAVAMAGSIFALRFLPARAQERSETPDSSPAELDPVG